MDDDSRRCWRYPASVAVHRYRGIIDGSFMSYDRKKATRRDEPSLRSVVVHDIRHGEFRRHVLRDVRDLYRFYLDEERREEAASMGRVKRFFVVTGWLFKGMVLRLSPARRLLLLAALIAGLFGEFTLRIATVHSSVNLRFWGFVLLLLVLMLELKDKVLARDEIEVARRVQLALLPKAAPDCPGWTFWSVTLPANDVGGDLVDYLELPGGRIGAALGDVAGKGLGAALLMAKLQATLRALAPECRDLGDLGTRLNVILNRDGLENRYATLFYTELQPGSGVVRFLNAGHNPPFLLRVGGVEIVPGASRPLGMLPEAGCAEGRIELGPGDLLAVYSDGLSEARDEEGLEFGEERLREILIGARGLAVETVGERILEQARGFVGDKPSYDDLSLLLIRRDGDEGASR